MATTFDGLGKKGKTELPSGMVADNRTPIVYEYFIAKMLKSMAEAREKKAKKACEELGLFPPDAEPGTNKLFWQSPWLTLSAKTSNASSQLDADLLVVELSKQSGWTFAKAKAFVENCKKPKKAPVSYEFALVDLQELDEGDDEDEGLKRTVRA